MTRCEVGSGIGVYADLLVIGRNGFICRGSTVAERVRLRLHVRSGDTNQ